MKLATKRLYASAGQPYSPDLERAAAILRRGGTVAFATETVYGLGANALDPSAVEGIFVAKQRPSWDPLIVHVADVAMLGEVAAEIPPAAAAFMAKLWPGPLTLLVPRGPRVPDAVTAGRSLVGVRMPAHPVALALIRAAGVPVAAPSANLFGHVSPTTAEHVAADLDGRIDAILDSGETLHGLESTVVDASVEPCLIYRPGAVTIEQLRGVWPTTEVYVDRQALASPEPQALPSPGLSLRHYAPHARLVLVEEQGSPSPFEARAALRAAMDAAYEVALAGAGARETSVGLMQPLDAEFASQGGALTYPWAHWEDLPMLAHRLFAGLRSLDERGVAVIVCPVPAADGLGAAIRDRLRKAARQPV